MTVHIRAAEPADYEAISQIYAMPRAVWGTLQLPYQPAERWRKRLGEPPAGMHNLLATVDGEIVGQLGLHTFPNAYRRRHVGEMGMAVRDDWHGKGVGTALVTAAVELADRWLNLSRLELTVYVDNKAAIHLYTKFGFHIEGTATRYAFRDGAYVDVHFMARLR